jgi:hypothetical protein
MGNILAEPKCIGLPFRTVEASTNVSLGGGLLSTLECVVISV